MSTNIIDDCVKAVKEIRSNKRVLQGSPSPWVANTNIAFAHARVRYRANGKKGAIIKSPRRFGIEWEGAIKVNKQDEAHKGIPINFGGVPQTYIPSTPREKTIWCEVRTPPMRLAKGENDVLRFSENVKGVMTTNRKRDGTHVHIEALDIKNNKEKLNEFVRFVAVYEAIVHAMLPTWRTKSHWCRSFSYHVYRSINGISGVLPVLGIKAFFDGGSFDTNPSLATDLGCRTDSGVAVHTYGELDSTHGEHPTIEIRYHEATLDGREMLHWTAMWQHIMDNVDLLNRDFSLAVLNADSIEDKLAVVQQRLKFPTYILDYINKRILTAPKMKQSYITRWDN